MTKLRMPWISGGAWWRKELLSELAKVMELKKKWGCSSIQIFPTWDQGRSRGHNSELKFRGGTIKQLWASAQFNSHAFNFCLVWGFVKEQTAKLIKGEQDENQCNVGPFEKLLYFSCFTDEKTMRCGAIWKITVFFSLSWWEKCTDKLTSQ